MIESYGEVGQGVTLADDLGSQLNGYNLGNFSSPIASQVRNSPSSYQGGVYATPPAGSIGTQGWASSTFSHSATPSNLIFGAVNFSPIEPRNDNFDFINAGSFDNRFSIASDNAGTSSFDTSPEFLDHRDTDRYNRGEFDDEIDRENRTRRSFTNWLL